MLLAIAIMSCTSSFNPLMLASLATASSVFVSATKAVLACSLSILQFSARRPLVLLLLAMSIFAVARLSASGERTITVPGFVGLTAGKPGKGENG